MEIEGLSMTARAEIVTDRSEAEKVLAKLPSKYPQQTGLTIAMPKPEEVCIFRVTPPVVSVLDYSKDFGHTDLVAVS